MKLPAHSRRLNITFARTIRIIGSLILILAMGFGMQLVYRSWQSIQNATGIAPEGAAAIGILLLVLVVWSIQALMWLGHGIDMNVERSRRAVASNDSDPRAPVVYLRRFTDDHIIARNARAIALLPTFSRVRTEEELIADFFGRLGPVVALGEPDEALPQLGASRSYVPKAQWQQTVIDLLDRAGFVLLRVNASPGVLWEARQVFQRVPLARIALIVPAGDSGYQTLREVAHRSDVQLPVLSARRNRSAAWSIRAIILFDRDGRGQAFEYVRPRPFLAPPNIEVTSFLGRVFSHVLHRHGIDVVDPRPDWVASRQRENRFAWIWFVFSLVVGAAFAYWKYATSGP